MKYVLITFKKIEHLNPSRPYNVVGWVHGGHNEDIGYYKTLELLIKCAEARESAVKSLLNNPIAGEHGNQEIVQEFVQEEKDIKELKQALIFNLDKQNKS